MRVTLRQFIFGKCLPLLCLAFWTVKIPAASALGSGTILVLGDSIAAGYGVEREEAFPALLQEKLTEAGHEFEVVNGGVSGDTTAGGLRRIDWMLRRPFDIIILELGGNDGLRGLSPEQTKENLQGIIDKIRAKSPSTKIILAGMEMPANMGEEYTKEFKAIFPALAKKNDTFLVPFILQNVGASRNSTNPIASIRPLKATRSWRTTSGEF